MGNCLDRDDTGHTEDADGPLLPQGQDLRSFTVIVKPSEPSALLRWDPPADCDVTGYDVRFKSLGCAHYTELRVDADQTTCTLRVSDGLKPLNLTQFEVRLVQEGTKGGWSQQARFVDWHCKRPTCGMDRARKDDGQIYDFCNRTCARLFCSRQCMYPSCVRLQNADWFCSDHREEALQAGLAFVLELDPQGDKFKSIHKKFRKAWPQQAKGNPPKVDCVYKIVNPQASKHFEEYLHGLPHTFRKPTQLYHGTRLQCNMAEFPELCSNPNCGVCCMCTRGKAQQLVSEAGFYFSKNPLRAHDFTSSPPSGRHRAVLVCKVVVGNKSKGDFAASGGEGGPSPSPDSSGGHGDIVVRNIDAVCPQYIIIYTFP